MIDYWGHHTMKHIGSEVWGKLLIWTKSLSKVFPKSLRVHKPPTTNRVFCSHFKSKWIHNYYEYKAYSNRLGLHFYWHLVKIPTRLSQLFLRLWRFGVCFRLDLLEDGTIMSCRHFWPHRGNVWRMSSAFSTTWTRIRRWSPTKISKHQTF